MQVPHRGKENSGIERCGRLSHGRLKRRDELICTKRKTPESLHVLVGGWCRMSTEQNEVAHDQKATHVVEDYRKRGRLRRSAPDWGAKLRAQKPFVQNFVNLAISGFNGEKVVHVSGNPYGAAYGHAFQKAPVNVLGPFEGYFGIPDIDRERRSRISLRHIEEFSCLENGKTIAPCA